VPATGVENQIRNAVRLWNVFDILEDIGETAIARDIHRLAVEEHASLLREGQSCQKAITQNREKLGQRHISRICEGILILSWAALHGHEDVVKVLLAARKIDTTFDREINRTALWWAASNGHARITKLLLEGREINIDQYFVPLLYNAATFGYVAIAKLLLEMKRDDVDNKFIEGRTALSQASRKGHHEIITLLLDTGKVDIDSKDQDQRTSLSLAAGNGHERIVEQNRHG
jgi:ankyrin repeat protein